ncbi:uncharacterized protein L201_003292 [Kwoniella dendrophila CBS 6074]|uniref:Protein CPL1-like domain-containing protein n=1 Tax=Kwoniella dendrophila CBS 6074 TaxID=1295534 RepID=A0AAX4JSG3_9TREE
MFRSNIIITFLLASSTFLSVSADNLFVGCTTYQPADTSSATFKGFSLSTSACTTSCSGYIYSYYSSDSLCTCSNLDPSPADLQTGQSGTCTTSGQYEVNVVSTTYDSTTCYPFYEFTSEFGSFSVTGPKQCLYSCRDRSYAISLAQPSGGGSYSWYCSCSNNPMKIGTSSTTCGGSQYYVFNHPAYAKASQLAKRNAHEQASKKRNTKELCPGGLTACLVPGLEQSNAWECVDTQNDIDSCGGCVYGSYNNASISIGQPCNQKGVSLGAATCVSGQCSISKCQDGFDLIDNECISTTFLLNIQ